MPAPDADMPRWVKISGTVAIIAILLVAIAMFTGHGPGRHISGNVAPPPNIGEGAPVDHAPSEDGR